MMFSEKNLGIYSNLLYVLGLFLSILMAFKYDNREGYTILWMNRQGDQSYMQYIFYPTWLAILICLGVNLKYGKNKYLRTFRKNSHKFKLLFRIHFYYIVFWVIWSTFRFMPLILELLFKIEVRDEEWVGITSIGLALYPSGMLVWFTIAWFYNKRYYYQELSKIGYIERLLSIEENLKNFKEVIRKEVWEQIVKGMSLIFNEPEVFQRKQDSIDRDDSVENIKKNNILKIKDTVINLVKKTHDKLTNVDIKNRNIRRQVDLIDNMQIRRESRTKRSFYLGDEETSWSIEEYAPRIFQNIRRIFKVRNKDVLNIFKEGWEDELDINISTGKTGSFFLK